MITFINIYSENCQFDQHHFHFFERQLWKKNFNTQNVNQLKNQVDTQIDAQFDTQIDTQIVKQNDKRETIEIDNKRDDLQKNIRIIEMNVVKIFHQIVNTCLTSSQNDFQFMRKKNFNVDINEHNTFRFIERENANVNIENVFHCFLY